MRLLLATALGAFALAGTPAPLHAQQAATKFAAPKFAAVVPLLDCDGTPCIEATLGAGQILKLGIDTGNVDSVLDAKLAATADIKPSAPVSANAPSGMFRTSLPEIRIGSVTLRGTPAIVLNLAEMIEQHQMPQVDGTLAYTAFKDRILEFDFPAKTLRISEPLTAAAAPCQDACDQISLITFGKDGPPIVVAAGFELNGKKITAQVDTLFTGSLLVYSDSIAKLGLADAAATKQTEMFPLTDGGVEMRVASAKSVSFHGAPLGPANPKLYFPTPEVHEPDGLFDATVGLALLRNAILTLDFHNLTFSIRSN